MSDQGATGTMTRAVAAMLAPTLGWERSVEVVSGAIRRLGLKDESADIEDRRTILEDLALEQGIVGVTARYALSRTGFGSRPDHKTVSVPPSSGAAPESSASARLAATLGVHELVGQLATMMGPDKSETTVQAALKRLDLPRERLDREQATRLLDDLGRQEGLVGITVRFVRGKILARFGG
jgi:hypothetical protein